MFDDCGNLLQADIPLTNLLGSNYDTSCDESEPPICSFVSVSYLITTLFVFQGNMGLVDYLLLYYLEVCLMARKFSLYIYIHAYMFMYVCLIIIVRNIPLDIHVSYQYSFHLIAVPFVFSTSKFRGTPDRSPGTLDQSRGASGRSRGTPKCPGTRTGYP